ncbi:hypothetical protein Dimus_032020, partial [Dionaea muscipula]
GTGITAAMAEAVDLPSLRRQLLPRRALHLHRHATEPHHRGGPIPQRCRWIVRVLLRQDLDKTPREIEIAEVTFHSTGPSSRPAPSSPLESPLAIIFVAH